MIVVNLSAFAAKFRDLGWPDLPAAEVADWLREQSIPPAECMAYLNALIAAPDGLNDQTIAGCTPANAARITGALRAKGVVG